MTKSLIIGIDPGVNTGVAVWDCRNKIFRTIQTVGIITAQRLIEKLKAEDANILVRIEDARLRKWFGNAGPEKLQGAGSIKRDCSIWEEFLNHINVRYQFVAPKANKTKLNAVQFHAITKWAGITNEHGRDAAMLCFGI